MINIDYFIKALKVSWLRRVIQNSHDSSWYSLSMIDFQKISHLEKAVQRELRVILTIHFGKNYFRFGHISVAVLKSNLFFKF